MPDQLFLEHSAGLDKRTAIEDFVGHSQAFVCNVTAMFALPLQHRSKFIGRCFKPQGFLGALV